METKIEKYKEILNLFTPKDWFRPWMEEPWNIEGKTCTTNGWVVAICPKFGEFPEPKESTKDIYPKPQNLNIEISVEVLRNAIKQMPCEVVVEEEIEENECRDCMGTGEVTWTYEDYEKEYECPVCEGTGKVEKTKYIPTDKTEPLPDWAVKIKGSGFLTGRILDLIKVAEILEEKSVLLIHQKDERQASIFKIGDVELLVMPAVNIEHEKVIDLNL